MTDPVILQHNSPIGHIILNRPNSLNSLNLEMIQTIHAALDEWRNDPNIVAILVEGAGERAFCAGGDIRLMHTRRGDFDFGYDIFKTEYTLNHKIDNYPKPYISIMNGIVMGGGIGISVYGSHRIMTASTKFAMPECGIGLFPDVGGSYFLPKAPGKIGIYHALTGTPMDAADAIYAGMGTHYLTQKSLHTFKHKLFSIQSAADIDRLLDELSSKPESPSKLQKFQPEIDRHFSHSSLDEIYRNLESSEWGRDVKQIIDKNSPTSMGITFEAFRRSRGQTLAQVLQTELLLSQQCIRRDEFFEGVRAAVIDKDRNPKWNPGNIFQIDWDIVLDHFKPLPGVNCDIFHPQ